jgi:hypothetical protein
MDEERYTAKELVELALAGHFCVRAEIDRAIRRIDRPSGREGRERMNQLPDLRAYASEEEIDEWQSALLDLLAIEEASDRERNRAADRDPTQRELW